MKLKDLVAISGMPGLFRIVTNRSNGLVVEDIDTGKTRFFSVRKHQFTPLETVAIYTETDSIELVKVFRAMREETKTTAIPSTSTPTPALFDYFNHVLPEYDRDRVLVSDVKKIIKWFNYLESRNILNLDEEE